MFLDGHGSLTSSLRQQPTSSQNRLNDHHHRRHF